MHTPRYASTLFLLLVMVVTPVMGQVPAPVSRSVEPDQPAALPTCNSCFFAIKTEDDADEWWQQDRARALTTSTILLHPDYFTTDVEVVSDVLWVLRMGVGLTVSSSREDSATSTETRDSLESSTETANRLLQQGGTVHLKALYPVWFVGKERSKFATLLLQLGAGFDFPRVGAITEDPGLSGTVGLDLSGNVLSKNEKIGLEGGLHVQGYVFSDELGQRLGTEKRSSGILSVRGSLLLFRQTRLGLIFPIAKSEAFEPIHGSAYVQQNVNF